MTALKLIVTNGPNQGRAIILGPGETCLIGRGSQANFVIIDLRMSREHFLIVGNQDSWLARDVSSRHGTFLNNHQFEEELLEAGDVITAGDTKFLVAFADNSSKLDQASTISAPRSGH